MGFPPRVRVSVIFRVLALGVAPCGVSAFLSTAAWAGGVTATSVISTAKRAIAKESSVHVVFVGHSASSSKTETIIADVGRTSGHETIAEGKATVAIELSSTHAYVSGSSSGLTTLFGMSSADAKKLGTKWESWKAGTSQYDELKSDLTMSSVTELLPEAKGTKLSTVVTGASTYHVLKWKIAATSSVPGLDNTLTISTGAITLPVAETAAISNGARVTTTLSKWGEQVVVAIPPAGVTVTSS